MLRIMLPRIGTLYKIRRFKDKCLLFAEINNSLKLLNAFNLQRLQKQSKKGREMLLLLDTVVLQVWYKAF